MLSDLIPKLAEMAEDVSAFYPRPSLADPERCLRQSVYWGLGIPRQPLSGRAHIVFDDSSWGEELVRDWLRKSAYQIHSDQMAVPAPAPMKSGHIDGIITDLAGKDYLLEIKNISHFSFQDIWGGRRPIGYFNQMAIYLWGLQKIQPEITKGILLIKNKNQGQFLEFIVEYSAADDKLTILEMTKSTGETQSPNLSYPNITADAVKRFHLIQDYIDKKTLPKREYEQGEWRCLYCGWSEPCWKNYAEEFQALATEAKLDGEIETLAGYYLETNMRQKNMEKEAVELKEKIKAILKDKNVREGRAGEYLIKNKLQVREGVDASLLPAEIRDQYKKITQFETLTIRKINK